MISADFLEQCRVDRRRIADIHRDTPEGQRFSYLARLRDPEFFRKELEGRKPFDQRGRKRAFCLAHGIFAIDTPQFFWATSSKQQFTTRWTAVLNGSTYRLRPKK